jgi:hypothetical protein
VPRRHAIAAGGASRVLNPPSRQEPGPSITPAGDSLSFKNARSTASPTKAIGSDPDALEGAALDVEGDGDSTDPKEGAEDLGESADRG